MELRKHPSKDLESKRPLFFALGLIIAMSSALVAFEWRFESINPIDKDEMTGKVDPMDIVAIELPPDPRPEPKPKKVEKVTKKATPSDKIEIVEDDLVKIDVDIKIEDQLEKDDLLLDDSEGGHTIENTGVPTYAEKMPEFPGGTAEFLKFVGKNTRFTQQAKRMGMDGTVYVSFIVEKDGSLTDIKVVKGIGYGLDEEAVRVIKSSPKWEPGRQGGNTLRVRMMLPIKFKLK